jgi:hypothetical protein
MPGTTAAEEEPPPPPPPLLPPPLLPPPPLLRTPRAAGDGLRAVEGRLPALQIFKIRLFGQTKSTLGTVVGVCSTLRSRRVTLDAVFVWIMWVRLAVYLHPPKSYLHCCAQRDRARLSAVAALWHTSLHTPLSSNSHRSCWARRPPTPGSWDPGLRGTQGAAGVTLLLGQLVGTHGLDVWCRPATGGTGVLHVLGREDPAAARRAWSAGRRRRLRSTENRTGGVGGAAEPRAFGTVAVPIGRA